MPSIGSLAGGRGFGKVQYSPGVVPIFTAATTASGTNRTSTVTETGAPGPTTPVGNGLNSAITLTAIDPLGRGPVNLSLASGALPPGFTFATAANTQSIGGSYTIGGWNADALVYTFGLAASDTGPSPLSATNSYTITMSVPFKFRQIITRGYVQAGYKNSNPWKNITMVLHSTDAFTNKGDLLNKAGAYTGGVCGKDNAYTFSTDDAWPGNTSYTSSWDMRNETARTHSTDWDTKFARNDCEGLWYEHREAYAVGGGQAKIDVFNLSTEVMMADQSLSGVAGGTAATPDAFSGGIGGISHETKGFWWKNSDVGSKIAFSTRTISAQSTITGGAASTTAGSEGGGGQQKGMSSKVDKGYASNEGTYSASASAAYKKFTLSSETVISGTAAKAYPAMGEENNDMGQDICWTLGQYDGASQNMNTARMVYNTDTQSAKTVLPNFYSAWNSLTGDGRSSGATAWRD